MTTLEWLMIVGAVSGLAALAVVLVTGLVDETAEQTGGGVTTNRSAAVATASQIEQEARTIDTSGSGPFATWSEWDRYFTARCSRLAILYSSVPVEVEAEFEAPYGLGAQAPTAAELAAAVKSKPTASGEPAQIKCEIEDP